MISWETDDKTLYTEIDGVKIDRFSEYDGFPIKNKLPLEVRERLKTRKQWEDYDCSVRIKPDATPYWMHPSVPDKKLVDYYLDSDVEYYYTHQEYPCLACIFYPENTDKYNAVFCKKLEIWVRRRDTCDYWTSNNKEGV